MLQTSDMTPDRQSHGRTCASGYYELYAMLEDQRQVEPKEHPVSMKKICPANEWKQPCMVLSKHSCSTASTCSAQKTAHISARSGVSEESLAPRVVGLWPGHEPLSEESSAPGVQLLRRRRSALSREVDVAVQGHGTALERAASGSVPRQQAQHLMVFSRSLKRLARFVCLHS